MYISHILYLYGIHIIYINHTAVVLLAMFHPKGSKRFIPSGELTWQWKMDLLKMYSLLTMGIFHCHVSLLEGIIRLLAPNKCYHHIINVCTARSLANAAVGPAHPPPDHPAPYPIGPAPRSVPPTTEDPAPGRTPRPSSNKKRW